MTHLRRAALSLATVLSLASCGGSGRETPDVEQFFVDHGDQSLELAQRFDDGELRETVLTHHQGARTDELRVEGELLDAGGATEGGARVRAFLARLEPSLLGRLGGAGLRYDLAVLVADATLALDEAGRADAARQLSEDGRGAPGASLCVLLEACDDEPAGAPRT